MLHICIYASYAQHEGKNAGSYETYCVPQKQHRWKFSLNIVIVL